MSLIQNYALDDSITFSQTNRGIATVTLGSRYWSEISGIRKGYRLLLDNQEGEAYLLEDPRHESHSVDVLIILDLSTLSYAPGDWVLRVPRTKEVKDYLPKNVKTTLILPEYCDSLQNFSIDEIHDAIVRLRNLRDWENMDQAFLDSYLQTLGLQLNTDGFDGETRRRFLKEWALFTEIAGTKYFINYLSFAVDREFSIFPLWTSDYKDFVREEDIPAGFEEDYYPTNHVDLEFNATEPGLTEVRLVLDIFYKLASTPLVVQRINQILDFPEIEIQSPTLIHLEEYENFTFTS